MYRMIGIAAFLMLWGGSALGEGVRIGGTGAGLRLTALLAEAAGIKADIAESLGTSGGYRAMAAGKLDAAIGMRGPKPTEAADARSEILCRTPLVFYYRAARGDASLLRDDLSRLYSARLPAGWSGSVRPLLRPEGETSYIYLIKQFPELEPLIAQAREERGAVLALSDQDAMTETENSDSLVGFGPLAPMIAEKRHLRAAAFEGKGVDAVDYPFQIDLHLAIPSVSSPSAKRLWDFAKSPAGGEVMRKNGCIPDGAS